MPDASTPLLEHLAATLEKDESQRKELIAKIKVGLQRAVWVGSAAMEAVGLVQVPRGGLD